MAELMTKVVCPKTGDLVRVADSCKHCQDRVALGVTYVECEYTGPAPKPSYQNG